MNIFDTNFPFPILLASTSSYRKKQLLTLGYPFTTDSPTTDEDNFKKQYPQLSIKELAQELAIQKAKSLENRYTDHVIIGADQICHLENTIFSKPLTAEKALSQLSHLQGRQHTLTTSLCILYRNKIFTHLDQTQLHMRNLSLDDIKSYIQLDNPIYCAGSYMFEAHGHKLFSNIQTQDPSSIIGLPLLALQSILLQLANEP